MPDMPFIELQSIDSTNNYALTHIREGLAQHGMAVFSHEQTAGKGQRGKDWASIKGENIAISIILRPFPLQVSEQFQLSVCAALAVYEFFTKYAGTETRIKWPNDLYWRDRKAGGILIENIVGSNNGDQAGQTEDSPWRWAVVGVGININQTSFPPELSHPVSLKQITGEEYKPVDLARQLGGLVIRKFDELQSTGFDSVLSSYLSRLYKKDEKVKLKKDSRVFEATIRGVTPEGRLVVEHAVVEEFGFGEVTWLID
ncbi:MAG: biotin--[acetyl-CoA-carboxylase] ligase [Chitinophagaceae bacterium]|nr:biotin--[acetyl-CoA-carboxylase] ligase [Chitinophagaceae bacterium]